MALLAVLLETPATQRWAIAVVALLVLISTRCIYRIRVHPLAHIPGPVFAKCSSLWLHYHAYMGDETTAVHRLHKTYGPVVRVAPNDVDISDGEAIAPIYIDKGGFAKADCYVNFDIDGHASIFSTLSSAYRAKRAKAVVAMFSTASIRSGSDRIYECVDKFVSRLQAEASTGRPVNVLNLSRALATDAVSSFLFHKSYRGIEEKSSLLSVSPFVDAFVAVGRVFYLPNGVFLFLEWLIATFMPDKRVSESFAAVDGFVGQLVDGAVKDTETYPGRLLDHGISKSETIAQCKDIIFAGTDSTGTNLATICWHLSRHPEKYAILRKEILENQPTQSDIQTLPYLRGVLKEGLRLALANPSRLLRVVPSPAGWTFHGLHFPPGTNVGVSAFELHKNLNSFPSPDQFLPERWLDPTPQMQRDWMPFGNGTRACIARNLATAELFMAVERLVLADGLRGARPVGERIEILEWFNSKVRGGRVELVWAAAGVE